MMRAMDVIVRGIGFKSTRFHHPDANSDPRVGKLSEATSRVLARKSLSDLVPPLLHPPCIFKLINLMNISAVGRNHRLGVLLDARKLISLKSARV